MKKTNKLIIKIQRLLTKLNQREYLHHFGPKKYKLKQHLFALLFMQVAKWSFRRVSFLLGELGFIIPTYSALCKSRKKIPTEIFDKMLGLTINFKPKNVGIDSTGISIFNPSFHFVKRIDRDKPVKSFVKVSAFFDLDRKKFLSVHSKIDKRHDVNDFEILFKKQNSFKNLFADTAYDSEKVHEACFKNKIQTFIKPRKNVKRGFYRRKQMKNYSEKVYHKRSLIECGFSVLKRKFGGYSLAKSDETTAKEVYLRAIASNLNLRS